MNNDRFIVRAVNGVICGHYAVIDTYLCRIVQCWHSADSARADAARRNAGNDFHAEKELRMAGEGR